MGLMCLGKKEQISKSTKIRFMMLFAKHIQCKEDTSAAHCLMYRHYIAYNQKDGYSKMFETHFWLSLG